MQCLSFNWKCFSICWIVAVGMASINFGYASIIALMQCLSFKWSSIFYAQVWSGTDSKDVVGLKANMIDLDDKYRNVSQTVQYYYPIGNLSHQTKPMCKCFHSRYSRMASMLVLSLTLSLLWGMITLPLQMKHLIQFR